MPCHIRGFIWFPILVFLFASEARAQSGDEFTRILGTNTQGWEANKLDAYVKNGLNVVDAYMDDSYYDSAQILVDKLMTSYPIERVSRLSYILTVRQNEILYYNHLLQFGKDDLVAQLKIAEKLKDSFLLADACNFMGLFYLGIDSLQAAKSYFEKGIRYISGRQLPKTYNELTSPHHLYGNLAETYEKLRENDSTIKYARLSRDFAREIHKSRGEGIANSMLGKVWFEKHDMDSAKIYYQNVLRLKDTANDDVKLIAYSGLAWCALKENSKKAITQYIDKGFDLMGKMPNINLLFSKDFLMEASRIFHAINDKDGIYRVNEKIVKLDSLLHHNNLTQTNLILQTSIDRENRLLRMEVASSKYAEKLYMFQFYIALAIITILLLGLFMYRSSFRQKIKLATLRNNISRDLHDDVGATLSSIHIFGSVAEKAMENEPQKARSAIKNIRINSKELVDRMGDMIWAINSNTDADKTFSYRIKNFFYDLMNATDIQCTYNIDPQLELSLVHPDVRKNILFIAKESINNIVKYSKATRASIQFYKDKQIIRLIIKDNGLGFDMTKVKKGNGLNNIVNRASQLSGACHIESSPEAGTTVSCEFPITIISDKL